MYFFHGLESGPQGSKYRSLRARFPDIISPDFQGIDDIEQRLAIAARQTEGQVDQVIVGSSFGGLCAALLADRYPERVRALVLLAPALNHPIARGLKVPGNTVILHGTPDEVIPVQVSRCWAAERGLELIEVDDNHRLSASHGLMVELAARAGDVPSALRERL